MADKKTTEIFRQEMYQLVGDEYELLGEYINSYTPVKVRHTICNTEYNTIPTSFLHGGSRCPECRKFGKRKTIEEFKKEMFDSAGDEYELISDKYINNHTELLFKHKTCGHEFYTAPNRFLSSKIKCPNCRKKK